MNQELINQASELIPKISTCVLALIDSEGNPTASTVTLSKSVGIKTLTFCADINDNKAKRIKVNPKASVCFYSFEPLANITLVGKVEVLTDPESKKENWYDDCKHHWQSPEDPNYCVLKFTAERYNFFIVNDVEEGKF